MLLAEGDTPEYDAAGIVDPRAVEANITKRTLCEVLDRIEKVNLQTEQGGTTA
jgi:hypothetical protein